MKRTHFLFWIILTFALGALSTYAVVTISKYGVYGLKERLGIQGVAIFLEDSKFGASDPVMPVFVGNEDFPTNNLEEINPEDIPRKTIPVSSRGRVVAINLDQMKLFLYDDGDVVNEFQIHSKGIKNSLWDVPPGEYSVQYKNKDYFSPVAKTWMPYTVQFFNDFYIHGWPHLTDGDLVDDDFVAGAIRLSSKDAKEVYEFSRIGTDIVVTSSIPTKFQNRDVTGSYKQKDDGKRVLNVASRSYIVADIDTGQILFEEDSDRIYSFASISKLLTALTSLETLDQSEETKISQRAINTRGDQGRLRTGQKWQVGELLYPLLLESSNDAAEAIAEHNDRSEFMSDMNGIARSIGMSTAVFNDPSGLSIGNAGTAKDLLRLAEHIYNYKSYIFNVTQHKKYEIDGTTWYNNNPYKNDDEWLGGKNGLTTAAGHTLLSILNLELANGEKRNIIFVVLKSNDEDRDTRLLQSYVEKYVEFIPFESKE